jgi:hypothetical protein
MIEGIRKLMKKLRYVEIEWYKNGRPAALRTMRVFGDTETGAVRMSKCYRTPILSVRMVRWVYLSGAHMGNRGKGPGRYRVVSSLWVVTLGTRGGRPLVSVHLPPSVRRMVSEEAVRMLQGILSLNIGTDEHPLTCGVRLCRSTGTEDDRR